MQLNLRTLAPSATLVMVFGLLSQLAYAQTAADASGTGGDVGNGAQPQTQPAPQPQPAPQAQPAPAPVNYAAASPVVTDESGAATVDRDEQDESRSAFGFFFNPLYALLGRYELNLAYSPTHLVAINATGAYYDMTRSGIKMKMYGADLGAQFFLSGHRPMHGAYVYPRGVYYSAEATDGTTDVSVTIYGTAVTGGYQWNWEPFALRIGGGLVYYVASGQSDSTTVKVTLDGVAPMLDANIGLVF